MASTRPTVGIFIVLGCALGGAAAQTNTSSSTCPTFLKYTEPGYGEPRNCEVLAAKRNSLRIMYMSKTYVTDNLIAKAAALQKGIEYDCDNAKLATPECFVAGNWKHGWVGAFMWDVLQGLGVDEDVIAMTRANFSSDTDPHNATSVYHGASSFTRCVWEVRLGHVDMCIGDFWETEERRALTAFTTPFAVDQFLLVTLKETQTQRKVSMFDFPGVFSSQSMFNIFLPFELEVWLMNGVMIFLGGLSLWLIESTHPSYKDNPSRQPTFEGWMHSTYATILACLAPGQTHAPRSIGGRLVLFGISLHIFVILASYTASLASFLANQSTVAGLIDDINEISTYSTQDWMGRLCMLEAMEGLVTLNTSQIIGMDTYGPMFEQLYNHKCSAAVTGQNEYLTFIQGENEKFKVCANESDPRGLETCINGGPSKVVNLYECSCSDPRQEPLTCPDECPNYLKYCNFIPAVNQEDLHAALNWALPVAEEYVEAMSYMILRKRLQGALIDRRATELVNLVPDRCSVAPSDATVQSTQIGLRNLLGTYFYSTIVMIIGLILHAVLIRYPFPWWPEPLARTASHFTHSFSARTYVKDGGDGAAMPGDRKDRAALARSESWKPRRLRMMASINRRGVTPGKGQADKAVASEGPATGKQIRVGLGNIGLGFGFGRRGTDPIKAPATQAPPPSVAVDQSSAGGGDDKSSDNGNNLDNSVDRGGEDCSSRNESLTSSLVADQAALHPSNTTRIRGGGSGRVDGSNGPQVLLSTDLMSLRGLADIAGGKGMTANHHQDSDELHVNHLRRRNGSERRHRRACDGTPAAPAIAADVGDLSSQIAQLKTLLSRLEAHVTPGSGSGVMDNSGSGDSGRGSGVDSSSGLREGKDLPVATTIAPQADGGTDLRSRSRGKTRVGSKEALHTRFVTPVDEADCDLSWNKDAGKQSEQLLRQSTLQPSAEPRVQQSGLRPDRAGAPSEMRRQLTRSTAQTNGGADGGPLPKPSPAQLMTAETADHLTSKGAVGGDRGSGIVFESVARGVPTAGSETFQAAAASPAAVPEAPKIRRVRSVVPASTAPLTETVDNGARHGDHDVQARDTGRMRMPTSSSETFQASAASLAAVPEAPKIRRVRSVVPASTASLTDNAPTANRGGVEPFEGGRTSGIVPVTRDRMRMPTSSSEILQSSTASLADAAANPRHRRGGAEGGSQSARDHLRMATSSSEVLQVSTGYGGDGVGGHRASGAASVSPSRDHTRTWTSTSEAAALDVQDSLPAAAPEAAKIRRARSVLPGPNSHASFPASTGRVAYMDFWLDSATSAAPDVGGTETAAVRSWRNHDRTRVRKGAEAMRGHSLTESSLAQGLAPASGAAPSPSITSVDQSAVTSADGRQVLPLQRPGARRPPRGDFEGPGGDNEGARVGGGSRGALAFTAPGQVEVLVSDSLR